MTASQMIRREDLLTALRLLQIPGNLEDIHRQADAALLRYIDDLEVTEAFTKIEKWWL